jgi:hypothetical protein
MTMATWDTYLRGDAQTYRDCIEACMTCVVACEMCADACLDEQDVQMMVRCIRLTRDCADACNAALRTMSRGSPLAKSMCRACAEACEACAEECARHAAMAEHCAQCAEACRRCADACRRTAALFIILFDGAE